VLGVVVGVLVDGTDVVVDGVGEPGASARGTFCGIGGGDDFGAGAGVLPTSETRALDGGGAGADVVGSGAVDDGGAAGAAAVGLGGVALLRALEVLPEPRMIAVIPANPTTNARTHAATSVARRVRSAARFLAAGFSTPGGVVASGGNDSRTVAGETGTPEAFRNPRAPKRRRVSGRRRARAVACSSWIGP
jgi:hypothetical protein